MKTIRTFTLCALIAVPAGGRVEAGDLTAEDLIKLAPELRSSDANLKSLVLKGYSDLEGVRLDFRLLYQAPDRLMILVKDGRDGTPLLIATGTNALVYDPAKPVVVMATYQYQEFVLETKDRNLSFGWSFGGNKNDPDRRVKLAIDIKPLMATLPGERSVKKADDGTYQLKLAFTKGAYLLASVDPSQSCPYTRFEVFADETNKKTPDLCIDTLKVNTTIEDSAFSLPTAERIAEIVEVRIIPGESLMKTLGGYAMMFRGWFLRYAIHSRELRDSVKNPWLLGIDWDAVEKNDAIYAPALRKLFAPLFEEPKDEKRKAG